MDNDGYLAEVKNDVISLIVERTKIAQRLSDIDNEIDSLPPRPKDIESWIDSIPDIGSKRKFTFLDYRKLSKLQKEYTKLKEREEEIITKLRLYLIEDSIKLIEELNGK